MAKLSKTKYPELEMSFDEEGIHKMNELERELESNELTATEDNLVNMVIRYSVADSDAWYRVIEDNGGEDITLQHINLWGGYHVYSEEVIIKNLKRSDLINQLQFTLSLNRLKHLFSN